MNADRNTPHGTKVAIGGGDPEELFPAWFIAPSRTTPETHCIVEDATGWLDPWEEVTYDIVFIEDWKDETLYGELSQGPATPANIFGFGVASSTKPM